MLEDKRADGFVISNSLLGMLNIDVRRQLYYLKSKNIGLLGMLNIDVRRLSNVTYYQNHSLLGMLNIDVRRRRNKNR